jgi:DNA topoisomerase III
LTLTARHVDDTKVTDHRAIIPTEQRVDPATLSPDEKRIYDLIARRFLAAFYPDAVIERTTIITTVEGERFTTRGAVVLAPGWREVDPPSGTGRLLTTRGRRRNCPVYGRTIRWRRTGRRP